MGSQNRYEIVREIGKGSFATVYEARDRELGRAVAVKQIHAQYLSDDRSLERYWKEAQLLGSLQHPHIVTIYDIVRKKGWLILELMDGNLSQRARGRPMNLDSLRMALIHSLKALRYLHKNKIVHGDIKPANLLVSPEGRIKLGDFGLARRASADGSLLKGTTKFMAPEVVSDQFGEVGPASDLYSLGFSAYQLMCGDQFDELFPGLSAFGRDEQVAWMMWHAAPDRHLPEINRVLEGVPEDLALVIQRLATKDQSQRYRKASDAANDLIAEGVPTRFRTDDDETPDEAPKKSNRMLAIIAVAMSMLLTVGMLFIPGEEEKPKTEKPVVKLHGEILSIEPEKHAFTIGTGDDNKPERIVMYRGRDKYRIYGGDYILFNELEKGDRLREMLYETDENNRPIKIAIIDKPKRLEGDVVSLEADEQLITLKGAQSPKPEVFFVPTSEIALLLNNRRDNLGRPIKLNDIKEGDRVEITYVNNPTRKQPEILEFKAFRLLKLAGKLDQVDPKKGTVRINPAKGKAITLPLANDVEIFLNNESQKDQQLLRPKDLKAGDELTDIAYDTKVHLIRAQRVFDDQGTVEDVAYTSDLLKVNVAGKSVTTFVLEPTTTITLASKPATINDLRPGDNVKVTYTAFNDDTPPVATVVASRPATGKKSAILIALSQFDDANLKAVPQAQADVDRLAEIMKTKYQLDPKKLHVLISPSGIRLNQDVKRALADTSGSAELIVYLAGQAFADKTGNIWLPGKDFNKDNPQGLKFSELVAQMDEVNVKNKILLIDLAQSDDQGLAQPTADQMIDKLRGPRGKKPPFKSLTGFASGTGKDQRNALIDDGKHGLFGSALVNAYAGAADTNRDLSITTAELNDFLTGEMTKLGQEANSKQLAHMVIPQDIPPRLTEDAKKAIVNQIALLAQDTVNANSAQQRYQIAHALSNGEPDPEIVYALSLTKAQDTDSRIRRRVETSIKELKVKFPGVPAMHHCLAWVDFKSRDYGPGLAELTQMASKLPPDSKLNDENKQLRATLMNWMGRMRAFAAVVQKEGSRPKDEFFTNLDQAVNKLGSTSQEAYEAGRKFVQTKAGEMDAKIEAAQGPADRSKWTLKRARLDEYLAFPYDDYRKIAQKVLTQDY